jgi:hypothetical protein
LVVQDADLEVNLRLGVGRMAAEPYKRPGLFNAYE